MIGGLALAAAILAAYWLGSDLTPSMTTWALSVPPLAIIIITVAARLQDITALGLRWWIRRAGMLAVGCAAVGLIAAPLMGYVASIPTWRELLLYWGIALTWLTTPNMPPWHKYITGEFRLNKGQQA
jgi:hypothetical protein